MGDAPVAGGSADGYEERITATGLDEGTAFFLSQTTSTVDVIDGHTFVVASEFPNGATGEATYRLFAPTTMSPEDPPIFEGSVEGDEFRYRMTYAVDATAMPADLQAQIANGLPTAAPAVHRTGATVTSLGLGRRGGIATVEDGVLQTIGVLVDGLISQTQETGLDKLVEAGKKRGITGSATSNSWDAFKAGKKVWDAVDANGIIADALAELKALEKCASNPTNPLTQKEYKGDPAAKQQVLDTIADARAEIKANAGVLFSSLIMDTASGAVTSAPWLGFIVSPAVNYTKETLLTLVKAEVDRARQAVVRCETVAYFIEPTNKATLVFPRIGAVPGFSWVATTAADVCDVTKPFTLTGPYGIEQVFTPTGTRTGSTTYTLSGGGIPMTAEGTYEIAVEGGRGTLTTTMRGKVLNPGRTVGVTGGQTFRLTPPQTDACAS